MSLTNCPHCTSPIPPEFAVMPICSICGGDLSAAPAAPVWASIDIKTDNTRVCPNCSENIKSILAMECPTCGVELTPAGQVVEDIEKEKAAFEAAVSASNSPVSEAESGTTTPAVKVCPHCTSPIPPEFAVMPICSICGGDLSAAPAAPVWASIDIKTDNTRVCPNCSENIKSILAMECPTCGVELTPAGHVVEDIEKEKAAFEAAVSASHSEPEPTHISDALDHEKTHKAISAIVDESVEPQIEVASLAEEIRTPESVVINVKENIVVGEAPTIHIPEKILVNNPIMNPAADEKSASLKSSTSGSHIKPYPERDKEEDFVPMKERAQQKKSEGFFAKILRMLGLKKD